MSLRDSGSPQRAELALALSEVAQGDRAAFAQVYRRTSAKLFGVCLRILGNRSEAEDALQEVYVNIWHKAASFDPSRASPITWLAALARNKAIDRARSRGVRQAEAIDSEAAAVADPSPSALDQLEAEDQGRILSECIGELEERQASAIRKAFFNGTTYAELAEQDGVPLGTMKSWVRRGLMRLKACIER